MGGALFNRHGFDAVSIDEVMKGAGLTRGGFYHHFASKESLYAAAVSSFSSCNPFADRCARSPRKRTPRQLAELLVDTYLSDETLADVERHCPLIALPLGRRACRVAAASRVLATGREYVGDLSCGLPPVGSPRCAQSAGDRQPCVGGMLIARTTDEPGLRKQLRATARAEALRLLAGGK